MNLVTGQIAESSIGFWKLENVQWAALISLDATEHLAALTPEGKVA
jgi:hypothetical protein